MKDTRFAVVNTLHYGRHKDYENTEKLMAVLKKLDAEWIKGKDWNYNLDYEENDDLAIINLSNTSLDQLEDLAKSEKGRLYIDFKNHIIVPTYYECDD